MLEENEKQKLIKEITQNVLDKLEEQKQTDETEKKNTQQQQMQENTKTIKNAIHN